MAANPYSIIQDKLKRREPVLLDGALGTELVRRGVRWRQHGLRTDAAEVQKLHEDYIAAGADVITTNTFQLTRRLFLNLFQNLQHMRRIGREGLEEQADSLTRKAVQVAQQARRQAGQAGSVALAGSIAPLEHCFRPDLTPSEQEIREEQGHVIEVLVEAGVDLLLLESMNTLREAGITLELAAQTGLPVWISFVLGPQGNLLSGEPLEQAVQAAAPLHPEVVLVNCAPPDDITRALRVLADVCPGPFGGYAQAGRYDPPSWKFEFHPQFCGTDEWPPHRYAERAQQWLQTGARVVGGCCGTGPDHIRALRRRIEEAARS